MPAEPIRSSIETKSNMMIDKIVETKSNCQREIQK